MRLPYYDPKFYGTDGYHRYPIGGVLYTDSVSYFCEAKAAWWTLDVIGSYMDVFRGDATPPGRGLGPLKTYDFLVITFDVYFNVKGSRATFTVKEDDGIPPIITQEIEYTDLQVSIKLFLENGILLFPSDH